MNAQRTLLDNSFTAKAAEDAKERKSLTAKHEEDTKEKKSFHTKDAKEKQKYSYALRISVLRGEAVSFLRGFATFAVKLLTSPSSAPFASLR